MVFHRDHCWGHHPPAPQLWRSAQAVDRKIGDAVTGEEDCQRIRLDIDTLETWAEKWLMKFNSDKCEVIHFGRSKAGGKYILNGRTL